MRGSPVIPDPHSRRQSGVLVPLGMGLAQLPSFGNPNPCPNRWIYMAHNPGPVCPGAQFIHDSPE